MASITIDPTATIAPINPWLFGHFVEHLGRCVYGGIYEPDSPHADETGVRADVREAVRGLAPTQLRYPGGNFVSGYHWRDGVGPRAARPLRFDHAWRVVETNQVGTHEFMAYARSLGAAPHLCVNLGSGTPEEAADWVEYCNAAHDTSLTRQRAANGHPQPFAVPLWDLGNEINGTWQVGHKSAATYAEVAREAALRMREVDPSIKLVACGWENSQAWNATVLDTLASHADYLSLHLYLDHPNPAVALAMPLLLEQLSRWHGGLARLVCREKGLARVIPLAWDEWGVWSSNEEADDPHAYFYTLKSALMVAGYLNAMLRCADIIGLANYAQLVNLLAPIYTRPAGLFRQTVYWPLQLYRRLAGWRSLTPLVACEGYRAHYAYRGWQIDEQVPYLDVSLALSPDGGAVTLAVINRHLTAPVEAALRFVDVAPGADYIVEEINAHDINARNSFEQPDLVTTRRRVWTPPPTVLAYAFPPHSLTLLTVPLS